MAYFLIIAVIVVLDQWSKSIVLQVIGIGGEPITVIDRFFYIVCHRNSGAAWGILENGRIFFIVSTVVVLVFAGFYMWRIKNTGFRILLSLFLGGAIGNFLDRLLIGSVVDFLNFYIFGYNFPTFNVADSFIVIGVISLAVYIMVNKDILAMLKKPIYRIHADKDG
ncbi:MAG: signal peptidase II [Oscillospiraceae bacterium]|nr:signal peptidase II [Oscillospiraceae bacterium]